jgi:hypothetical protein
VEQLCAKTNRRQTATELVEQIQKPRDGLRALVSCAQHPRKAQRPRQRLSAGEPGPFDERRQPDQNMRSRLVGPCHDGAVALEPGEIQGPPMEPAHPLRYTLPAHAVLASSLLL